MPRVHQWRAETFTGGVGGRSTHWRCLQCDKKLLTFSPGDAILDPNENFLPMLRMTVDCPRSAWERLGLNFLSADGVQPV